MDNRYACLNRQLNGTPDLLDAVWDDAPRATLCDVVTGATPFLLTEFRMLRDDVAGALYVRFWGEDDGVVSTFRLDDECLWKQDVFEIFLHPGNEPGTYLELEASPWDVRFVGSITGGGTPGRVLNMDAAAPGFATKTRYWPRENRTVSVWRIPYADIPFTMQPGAILRANLFRVDHSARGEDLQAWQPTGKRAFHVPEFFGYIDFPG